MTPNPISDPDKKVTRGFPAGMRFQERDGAIFEAIFERDGVLSRRQLKALFWPERSWRAMEKRLAKLHAQRYLAWPSREAWRTRPIPEPVIWLDWKGIAWIAGRRGSGFLLPVRGTERDLRRFAAFLRGQGIHWVREPRWSQLAHDLAVGDFRLAVEKAAQLSPVLALENWVNESVFHAHPDEVEYTVQAKEGSLTSQRKRVTPDGYFAILDRQPGGPSSAAARARFLLEVDLGTHDQPSFCREKVLPGIAYLLSPVYRERFGDNSGRWLVVTTGERRLRHMQRQARRAVGSRASAYYFTTFDRVHPDTVLTAPIWEPGGEDRRVPLFYR